MHHSDLLRDSVELTLSEVLKSEVEKFFSTSLLGREGLLTGWDLPLFTTFRTADKPV